jgi:hypothetical protein
VDGEGASLVAGAGGVNQAQEISGWAGFDRVGEVLLDEGMAEPRVERAGGAEGVAWAGGDVGNVRGVRRAHGVRDRLDWRIRTDTMRGHGLNPPAPDKGQGRDVATSPVHSN